MSEVCKINQRTRSAYPTRFFSDGIEISSVEFYSAIRSHYTQA